MRTRILVAIPIVAFLLAAIFVQGWLLALFAVLLGLLCPYEVNRALGSGSFAPLKPVTYTFAIIVCALFAASFSISWVHPEYSLFLMDGELMAVLYALAIMAAFIACMFAKGRTLSNLTATVFVLAYPQLFNIFFYLLVLRNAQGNAAYFETAASMLTLFLPPMLSDTLAYFWGRKFGKTKLAPVISPKKTVAGSVAGIVGGALGGVLVYVIVGALMQAVSSNLVLVSGLWVYLAIGTLLAVLSQFGDLAASYIKRAVDIKDFGRLLPGHGGVMDRVDSTLFIVPVVYFFAAAGFMGTI